MAELVNTFSWSFSAASDFEECRRKRYWGKYAMWGGWKDNATPLQRSAYQLNKMQNGYSLLGNAVENAVLYAIRRKQEGADVTADEVYQNMARPFLNNAWKQSLEGHWKENPRKYFCLKEHYYHELDSASQSRWTAFIMEQTRLCIANFLAAVLPRLAGIHPTQEVAVASYTAGDPESFALDGVKIYAIPDYVYRTDNLMHIHDWKSGRPRATHHDQMILYALWANRKYGLPADRIRLHLEYLSQNVVEDIPVNAEALAATLENIQVSVRDMTDYLVDGDLARNAPLPREEWDLAFSRDTCRLCNFYELCKPEMDAGE